MMGPGHGADTYGVYQRGYLFGQFEDLHINEFVIIWLQRYLANAGLETFSIRERSFQENEVIIDSEDAEGYAETGSWETSNSSVAGQQYGLDYRIATSTSSGPHSTATWTPEIPEEGFYPVYVYYAKGSNRNPTATYTINHSGGSTEVTIDQREYGNQFRHLGTFYFETGRNATRGSVSLSSEGSGAVTHADAVRFGGGTYGNINYPMWKMDAYRFTSHLGFRAPSWTNDVTVRPDYTAWLVDDTWRDDWRYLSIHTNAAQNPNTSQGIGTFVYNNGRPPAWGSTGSKTYTDAEEAKFDAFGELIKKQFLTDMRGVESYPDNNTSVPGAPVWEPDGRPYANYGGFLRAHRMWFGELKVRTEMPHTLVEMLFHDTEFEVEVLKNDRWRHDAARSLYKAIARSFNPNATIVPLPPKKPRATVLFPGQYQLNWTPVNDPMEPTAAPTGYKIYRSSNGYGWDNGTEVGDITEITLASDPGELVFIRIAATNAGGESLPSECIAVSTPSQLNSERLLLVNGFDRTFRYQVTNVPGDNDLSNTLERYQDNYVIGPAKALHTHPTKDLAITSTTNEAIIDGEVDLKNYDLVIWLLGEESTEDETFSVEEQALIEDYLENNSYYANRRRSLFVSGSELAWDLDGPNTESNADRQFYNLSLKADYVGDDANSHSVTGVPNGPFNGLTFGFGDGTSGVMGDYNVDHPDVIQPSSGSVGVLRYSEGNFSSGNNYAGVFFSDNQLTRILNFGFPVERVRADSMQAVMTAVADLLLEENDNSGVVIPTAAAFAPLRGPVGTEVEIIGSGLSGVTTVRFGTKDTTDVTILSSTRIRAVVPAGATDGPITVFSSFGSFETWLPFEVVAPPTLSGFAPSTGAIGASVTITGTGFNGATGADFGQSPAFFFQVVSDTQILTNVPLGATTGPIKVLHPDGNVNSVEPFIVEWPPGITSFSPEEGPEGTLVTINGDNFTGVTDVEFNGLGAESFQVVNPGTITAIVPAGATNGPIRVATPWGAFTSVEDYLIDSGSPGGGGTDTTDPSGGVSIPDDNPSGVRLSANFAVSGSISGLWINLDISHSWVGDLKITLTAPSGKTVIIRDREGGSADDIFLDREPVSGFLGESASGEWTLNVSDNVGFDTGILNSWSLEVDAAVSGPGNLVASDGTYNDRVSMNWDPVGGAGEYEVYRAATNQSGSSTKIGMTSNTTYDDSTATAGLPYHYWIRAKNADGLSPFSNGDRGYKANRPPIISEGTEITVNMSKDGSPVAFDLELNGSDPEGQTVSWILAQPPVNGQATVPPSEAQAEVAYTPDSGFTGTDTFLVDLKDPVGAKSRIRINVKINASNAAPTDIALSTAIISDTLGIGETVGTFTVTDPNGTDSHTLTLVAGVGDNHNDLFDLVGDRLLLLSPLDSESERVFSIRVRAEDPAGASREETFAISADYLLFEDLESSDPQGWTTDSLDGQDEWFVAETGFESVYSFVSLAEENGSDSSLVSPAVTVSVQSPGILLSFYHRLSFEEKDAVYGWDVGVLEVSFDSGTTWEDVEDAGGEFRQGGYTHETNFSTNNPLGPNRRAWSDFIDWNEVIVLFEGRDVAGETIQFRWRFASDGATASQGWLLDNIWIRDLQPESAPSRELIFSEYIEPGSGDSSNKVVEIFNGTGRDIDLAAEKYSVTMHNFLNDGSRGGNFTFDLTGILADGDVYVAANASADNATVLVEADQLLPNFLYNGDDTLLLRKDGIVVDSIGQFNFDPGSEWEVDGVGTQDVTLRRKPTLSQGDTISTDVFNPSLEWDAYPVSTYSGLGWHESINANQSPRWETTPVTEAKVGAPYLYNFVVVDPNFNDPLTLFSSPLPDWLTLNVEGSGGGSLSGIPANEDLGVVSVTLRAEDSAGILVEQVFDITVSSTNAVATIQDFFVSLSEDSERAFSASEFSAAFEDPDGAGTLERVEITRLPAIGKLRVDGFLVGLGEILLPSELNNLVYRPSPNRNGSDVFSWKGWDGQEYSANEGDVNLVIIDQNDLPSLGLASLSVWSDTPHPFSLRDFNGSFFDLDEGDAVVDITIRSLPSNGTLTFGGASITVPFEFNASLIDQLVYTPDSAFVGTDLFTWNASDGKGYAASPTRTLVRIFAGLGVGGGNLETPAEFNVGSYEVLSHPGKAYSGPNSTTGPLELKQVDGSTAPDWMAYDPDKGEITGSPLTRDAGIYELSLSGFNADGEEVSTVLKITVPVDPNTWAEELEEKNGIAPGTLAANLGVDIDGDSIPELLEFALGAGQADGMDPTRNDSSKMPQVKTEDGYYVLPYHRNEALAGLSYFRVQVSCDLVHWYDIDDPEAPVGFIEEKTGMASQNVEKWEARIPIDPENPCFFRIVVRQSESNPK